MKKRNRKKRRKKKGGGGGKVDISSGSLGFFNGATKGTSPATDVQFGGLFNAGIALRLTFLRWHTSQTDGYILYFVMPPTKAPGGQVIRRILAVFNVASSATERVAAFARASCRSLEFYAISYLWTTEGEGADLENLSACDVARADVAVPIFNQTTAEKARKDENVFSYSVESGGFHFARGILLGK